MYELVLCEPYDSKVHWDNRITRYNNNWLLCWKIYDDFMECKEKDWCQYNLYYWRCSLENSLCITRQKHKIISNYSNVIINLCSKPQIVKKYRIGDTYFCVIKTFWLKIFQRKYKNYYNKKMKYYKNPKNILNRSIYGRWV